MKRNGVRLKVESDGRKIDFEKRKVAAEQALFESMNAR
jgi:hypothetical protein